MIVLIGSTLEPMAEFKKFIASLLTPTIISATANTTIATIINMYIFSIIFIYFSNI